MPTIALPPDPASLAASLGAVGRALEANRAKSIRQSYRLENILGAFQALKEQLKRARGSGGIINPWSIMGLKRDELRNAAAMAGLQVPISPDNTASGVWADTAYRSKKNEAFLAKGMFTATSTSVNRIVVRCPSALHAPTRSRYANSTKAFRGRQ